MNVRAVLRGVVASLALASAAAPAAAAAPSFQSGNGISVGQVKRLSSRQFDVALRSSVVDGPLRVRVLLPADYDERPGKRWPVLYLFHGTSGGASDWPEKGDAERTTARSDFITVMPDAGIDFDGGGYCTDWFNRGAGGKPMWETFEIDQVVPWIDANLRTLARREGRAIFGLSQGGFCAFSLAARHPDMFLSAGSYSGAIDSAKDAEGRALMTPVVQATTTGLNGNEDPDAIFGPRPAQEINWAAHDPATLVPNMRGMSLYAYTGDGRPGPLDGPEPNPAGAAIESGVRRLTQLWKANADAAQIPVEYHDYGAGTHTWPYWARDLRESVGDIERDFTAARPAPAEKFFMSADARWSQWGYDVTLLRPAREFSTLRDADADGFTLLGSGSGVVVTPAAYEPGAAATVRTAGAGGDAVRTLRVRRDGRLRVEVPLGPGNPYQQSTPEAEAAGGTKVFTTRVAIDAPRRQAGSTTSSRRCTSRRSIVFRTLVPRGARIVSVRAVVRGRKRAVRAGRRSVTLSLRGLPASTYRVRLVLRVREAGRTRTIRITRRFRTCAPRRR